MTSRQTQDLAAKVIAAATERSLTLATAESCTGGLIGAALTDVPGASAVFTHGFITYANEAKRDVLGVPQGVLDAHGAVSAQVALAMAKGAARVAGADLSVAVTGIAGPGGGTAEKPVGLVYIASLGPKGVVFDRHRFPPGDRQTIRELTVRAALRGLMARIG